MSWIAGGVGETAGTTLRHSLRTLGYQVEWPWGLRGGLDDGVEQAERVRLLGGGAGAVWGTAGTTRRHSKRV